MKKDNSSLKNTAMSISYIEQVILRKLRQFLFHHIFRTYNSDGAVSNI
jgi:hypothetical protein